jgi:ATP-dependent DNA helicase RecG
LIFREVVANLLVHREFSNAYPATMTIYKNEVVTENWSRPYVMGRINLENLKPHPKNPTIANFFKQLGWVEELGSGVRKMYKYCPIYVNGALPVIEEGDVFKLTIKYEDGDGLNVPINIPDNGILQQNVSINVPINDNEILIMSLLKVTPGMNREEISVSINRVVKTVSRYINSLKKKNLIEYRGSRKTGEYYIITDNEKDK